MKTEKKSIPDQVFKELLLAISDGEITPGERLPSEFELCEQFGVSRPSVKTAIDRLKLLGIVEQRVGDGTYAKEIGMSDFFSIYATYFIRSSDIRQLRPVIHAIETESCFLITNSGSPEPIMKLREQAQMIILAAGKNDQSTFLSTALAFHRHLCAGSENYYLQQLFTILEPALETILSSRPEFEQPYVNAYQNLCDALEHGDCQSASAALLTILAAPI